MNRAHLARLRQIEARFGARADVPTTSMDEVSEMAPREVMSLYRQAVKGHVRLVGGPPAVPFPRTGG